MGKISKKSAKKIRDALHASESFEGSTSAPPTQLPKFPDINVWQEAANYYRAYQLRTAPTSVVEPPANKLPVPPPRIAYDPETVSLEDLDRAHIRFVQDLLRAGTPITEAIYDLMDELRSRVEIREAGVNLACPNQAVTDLWRKVARKAAKIAYQHEYYGTVLRKPVLTQSRVQPVTTTATTTITAPADTATSAAFETTPTDPSSATTAGLTAVFTPETGDEGVGELERETRGEEERGEREEQGMSNAAASQPPDREPLSDPTASAQPAPLPLASHPVHTVFDTMLHEPAWFDWAVEVDVALGLNPPIPTKPTAAPITIQMAPHVARPRNPHSAPACATSLQINEVM